MPLYEYLCDQCGHTTEALRPMADADEPLACEKCGSAKTRRAHSVFAAQTGSAPTPAPACGQGGCAGGACPFA